MLLYEQQLRAAEIVAVNLHRERYAAGLEPSYLDMCGQDGQQYVEPTAIPAASVATAELSSDVQGGVRAALAGTFIGSKLGLTRRG
jgi:hypothetical protein